MQCQIIACERVVFSGASTSVYARSHDGWFGVLPGHAPAVFALADAELRVNTDVGTRTFRIRGGTLYVTPDRVTALTEQASPVS